MPSRKFARATAKPLKRAATLGPKSSASRSLKRSATPITPQLVQYSKYKRTRIAQSGVEVASGQSDVDDQQGRACSPLSTQGVGLLPTARSGRQTHASPEKVHQPSHSSAQRQRISQGAPALRRSPRKNNIVVYSRALRPFPNQIICLSSIRGQKLGKPRS